MRFDLLKPVYCEEAGSDGDAGGGASGPTLEELAAQLADSRKQLEAVKGKNDELLGEAKKAKAARREEESARLAAEQAKAKEKGDYEQLHKSAMAELEKEREAHRKLAEVVGSEKKNNAAMKIATELADGHNVDLLSGFIAQRLKVTDDGIKVTDANGELTVSTLGDLAKEFRGDAKFSALLKGNQSSGGGAAGGSNGGGAAKVKTRAEFEALDPAQQMDFVKSKGVIND